MDRIEQLKKFIEQGPNEAFPRYALAGEPIRDGRARFRGFRNLPVRVAA